MFGSLRSSALRVLRGGVASNEAGLSFGPQDPLTGAESLALIEAQRTEVARRLGGTPALYFGLWGAAYLVGFGSIFLTFGSDPVVSAPGWVSGVLTGVLFVAASVVSGVRSARAGRGIDGPSRVARGDVRVELDVGFPHPVGVNVGLTRLGLSAAATTLLWSGSSLLLVGVLFLTGAAWCRDWFQYGLGVWMLLTGAGSVFAGVRGNFAVLSLAGGGGLLVATGYFVLRRSSARA